MTRIRCRTIGATPSATSFRLCRERGVVDSRSRGTDAATLGDSRWLLMVASLEAPSWLWIPPLSAHSMPTANHDACTWMVWPWLPRDSARSGGAQSWSVAVVVPFVADGPKRRKGSRLFTKNIVPVVVVWQGVAPRKVDVSSHAIDTVACEMESTCLAPHLAFLFSSSSQFRRMARPYYISAAISRISMRFLS